MKRTAAAFMLLAGLGGGCMTTDHQAAKQPAPRPAETARAAKDMGPHGEPITPVTARGQAPGGIVRADARQMPAGGVVPVGGFGPDPGEVAKGGWVPTGNDG